MSVTGANAFTDRSLNRYVIPVLSSATGPLMMPLPAQRDERGNTPKNQGRGGQDLPKTFAGQRQTDADQQQSDDEQPLERRASKHLTERASLLAGQPVIITKPGQDNR